MISRRNLLNRISIPIILLYARTYILLYQNIGAATPNIFILGGACVMSVLLLIET